MFFRDSTDFEDSIEFGNDLLADSLDHSTLSEAVPLKLNISLKDIFIPSHVLQSTNVSDNKVNSVIFHTLQKPIITDRFSVYSDECLKNDSPKASSDKVSVLSPSKFEIPQKDESMLPSSGNLSESLNEYSDECLKIDSLKSSSNKVSVLSPSKFEISQKDESLLPSSGKLSESLNEYSDECLKNDSPKASSNKVSVFSPSKFKISQKDKSLLPSSGKISESLNEYKSPFSFDEMSNEIMELLTVPDDSLYCEEANNIEDIGIYPNTSEPSNQAERFTGPDKNLWEVSAMPQEMVQHKNVDRLSEILKDSLEELYYSEEDDYLNRTGYKDDIQQQLSEITANTTDTVFKDALHTTDSQMSSYDNKNTLPLQNNNVQILGNRIELFDETAVQESLEKEKENIIQKVVEYPIQYIRPALEENVTTKTQKKQKKKKNKKVILENFISHEREDNNEFYNSVIQREKLKQMNEIQEFPFLSNILSQLECKTPLNNITFENSEATPECVTDNSQVEDLSESNNSVDEWSDGSENTEKSPIIIIEKLPVSVTKEEVINIVAGFGTISKINLQLTGNYVRAQIKMDSSVDDIDWIVDCLHGSQPFGSPNDQEIICYKS